MSDVNENDKPVFNYAFHYKDDHSPLHYAAEVGDLEGAKWQLENVVDDEKSRLVNAQDNSGDTPLHLALARYKNAVAHEDKAVIKQFEDVVVLLLEHGANPFLSNAPSSRTAVSHKYNYPIQEIPEEGASMRIKELIARWEMPVKIDPMLKPEITKLHTGMKAEVSAFRDIASGRINPLKSLAAQPSAENHAADVKKEDRLR